MKLKKYLLLALITLSLTISESCGVNFKLTLLNSTAVAQTVNNRKVEADRLLKQGNKQYDISQFKQALQSWEQSLAIYREIGDRSGIANSLNNLGNTYDSLGDYRKAIDYYQQSLKIKNEIGNPKGIANSLGNLGVTYYSLGDYRKAIDYHQQSLKIDKEIGNPKGIAISLNNLGLAYDSLGDYHKAIDYNEQSLKIHRQIPYPKGIAASVNNLGNAYDSLGDYREAIDYHQQALKIYKEIGNREGIANSLGNLGNAYFSLGDYRKAIDYQEQALKIYKEIGNREGIANSLGNLGIAYSSLRDYRQAIDYQEQSLKINKEIGNPKGIANSLGNLGIAHRKLGDYRKAIQYYQQALKIDKEIGNPKGIANSMGNLGLAYGNLGDYRKAIQYHQQALKINKEIANRRGIATSLCNMAWAYKKLKDYENAENTLREEINNWEKVRSYLGNQDANKITIFDTHARAYRQLQQVLVARKQPLQALEIAEQGRNRALVEILWRELSQKPEEELIPPSPKLAEIKQIAQQQNATLVEYSLTPDEIYIWVIPPQGQIQFRNVPLPKNISLKELVKISRDSIGVRGRNNNNSPTQEENPTNRLKQLHQLLIKPIADLLPKDEQQRVIFIPHQELFSVPFVALQDEKDKYLIEKHTILTAPSIQALDLSQKNKQAQKNPSASVSRGDFALIVGNPTMPKGGVGQELEPLKPLPGAEEEANKIAEMLNTKAIIGSEATESAIVQKMASAKLIHLATHGLLDDTNAIGSPGAIALTPDTQNDGFLTTVEIMENFGLPGKPRLQADLIVLSACDTGRGGIRSEGVIGLSRAFMASGVPTLVVSLWKVPDDATTTLMTEFYTNIYERKFDKAKAMREAMLTMINDDDPDPKNWAAFTVIGKAE